MNRTRDDIARMARVSSATVSRVFNYPDLVSEKKRQRVLAAAQKVGYRPNYNARALRRRGSGMILFLEKEENQDPNQRFYQWLYIDVLRGMRKVLEEQFFHLTLDAISAPEDLRTIQEKNPCEGIICHNITDRAVLGMLEQIGLPYVCPHQTGHLDGYNRCYTDDFHGGLLAARKFRETGHKHPAHITGLLRSTRVCRLRWEGFQAGFEGITPELVDGELGIRGGYESAQKLIPAIRSGAIDSIFVVNDLTAVGAIHALQHKGIRIPHDVSLIAYDNLPFVETLPFRLTTVDQHLPEVYQEAARLLLKSVRDGSRIDRRIEPVLIEGESVMERK